MKEETFLFLLRIFRSEDHRATGGGQEMVGKKIDLKKLRL